MFYIASIVAIAIQEWYPDLVRNRYGNIRSAILNGATLSTIAW